MIRAILFLSAICLCFSSFAQDTLLVHYDAQLQRTTDTSAPNLGILVREGSGWSAYVLDKASGRHLMIGYYAIDDSTEEGPFDYYMLNGVRYLHGYYHEGKRIGLWKEWDEQQRLTDSVYFDAGIIALDVQYRYGTNGDLSSFNFTDYKTQHRLMRSYSGGSLYNESEWWGKKGAVRLYYDDQTLSQLVEYDSTGKKQKPHYYNHQHAEISEAAYTKGISEDVPEFKGGRTAFQSYFERNMHAPGAFRFPNSSITVTVTFMLDEKGKAYNVKVLEYSDLEWQHAAIDFFAGMPNWDMKGHKGWGPLVYSFQMKF